MRVLVVDDNADAVELLSAALEMIGHQSLMCHDGASALEQAANERPDVALVDVGLPVIDGYEVARQVRAALAGQPMLLIALTGYGQPEHRARTRAAGFDVHLTKPVATATLRGVLAQHQATLVPKPAP